MREYQKMIEKRIEFLTGNGECLVCINSCGYYIIQTR